MQLTLTTRPPAEIDSPALAILAFAGTPPPPDLAGGVPSEMFESCEFTGKTNETALVHLPQGLKARRLLLAGCGERAKFTPATMRQTGGAIARALQSRSIQQAAVRLENIADASMLRAVVEGLITGGFEPDQYKTEKKNGGKLLERVEVSVPAVTPDLAAAFDAAQVTGEAQNWTRALVNEPGNVLTPRALADRARSMAEECGLACEILDEARLRQLGLNTLLGVAQGSAEPPVMIIVRYTPPQPSSQDHLALVGKGVTFDSGGISIKPGDGMETMKYDMAGA
ncbi:MAG: leucyl aminopeptidase family protein, partial [Bryobacteraceae bacterium]